MQTASLGFVAVSDAASARRLKFLKVSPTVETLYRAHLGLACAACPHGVGHRNPALPDLFKRQWRLTLLEIEAKCRCELCGSRNARVTAWSGGEGSGMDLAKPPKGWR